MKEPDRGMSRLTVKSSTIFISTGGKTEVYRSVNDVPPSLRKKLEQSTNGINSATILIADRKGKEEIVRAIRGLPSNLRARLGTFAGEENRRPRRLRISWSGIRQNWAELLLPVAIGLAVWFLFASK